MLLLNQALHTLQYYQESAVDLSKLGMQSCVGLGGRGLICCCFFRSFLRLPITWWVSPEAILPVVSSPWKSSLKFKADFSLAIWAPKDKIDSNELIVLAILSVFIYSFTFREHKFG